MPYHVERFIHEVEEAPGVWDRTRDEYKDRERRAKRWLKISHNLHFYDWNDYDEDKRREISLDLQRQWRKMKHEFFKEHDKRTNPKLKQKHDNKKKKFKYFENYLFLLSAKSRKRSKKAKNNDKAHTSSPWLTTDTYESDPNDMNNNPDQAESP